MVTLVPLPPPTTLQLNNPTPNPTAPNLNNQLALPPQLLHRPTAELHLDRLADAGSETETKLADQHFLRLAMAALVLLAAISRQFHKQLKYTPK